MVKINSTFAAALSLSLSLSLVFAHGPQGHSILEKRAATAVCETVYTPVDAGAYPDIDCVPFTQDPQVQTWLNLVNMTMVPVFPPSVVDENTGSTCPTDTTTIPQDQCWWTCQKCDAPDDITSCPTTGTWGLTYDDSPSPDSPRLYDNLLAHNQKATLFIVGSRARSYPTTLTRAYNEGHQIAIHTWSHHAMTSLTNEQVVAELKWTEKVIFDTIGVTPIYWRPPFGDVDARVRNIATQLGYKTSIWTQGFDTNDVRGTATSQSVVDTFNSWLSEIPGMKTGFIVLEHDLFAQEVDVSINGILPIAYSTKGLIMQPIAQCLNDPNPYKEGTGTFKLLPSNSTDGSTVVPSAAQTLAPTAAVVGSQTILIAGVTLFMAAITGI
ncbi:carbohydrate esterase family 4 protein [Dissophora ornata]|nr:carbohydrate esterase family 4 protein [Dissophora ornata]